MEISYFGHSCFRIKTKKAVVLTDPFDESVGLPLPKLQADIVTVSHDHKDHSNFKVVAGTQDHSEPFVIQGPGEYEISEVYVWGMPTYHDEEKGKKRGKNTLYFMLSEGIRICHLGDLGHPLSTKMADKINQTDILFVPVGGNYTLDAAAAVKVVDQISPSIVIPMHYRLPGSKMELAPVEEFLERIGAESVKPVPKLSVKTETMSEERQIVVLATK